MSVLEKRMYAILLSLAMGLGAWWLQNQWEETQRIDTKLHDFSRHVDSQYVEKEFLQLVVNEHTRRLERIENKLDDLIDKRKREGI